MKKILLLLVITLITATPKGAAFDQSGAQGVVQLEPFSAGTGAVGGGGLEWYN